MISLRLLVTVAVLLLSGGVLAHPYPDNGFVGIYGDPSGEECCISIPAFQPRSIYFVATTAGATASGFTAAEFRVETDRVPFPPYTFSYTPPVGSLVIGSPFDLTPNIPDDAGMNIAFSTCQPPANPTAGDRVYLGAGTVIVLQNSPPPIRLYVKRKLPPSDPGLSCPVFVLCDAPTYTLVCMTIQYSPPYGEPVAFVADINNPNCVDPPTCGFVNVETRTWSAVKQVYR